MNYKEAIDYINKVQWTTCTPGLERINQLLDILGNPQDKLKFIHIAGTNGKGSTAAMLASIMSASGYKTGLFTSPHLIKYNERIQIDGTMISDDEFTSIVERIKKSADNMKQAVTEFEMLTAIGMMYFYLKKCDIVVLEVGMGGELDSTNIIKTPELAVITAIGFDHCRQLGNTLTAISRAKAGIIKEHGDVLAYGGDDEVVNVFEKVCQEKHARLYLTDFSRVSSVSFDLDSQHFCVDGYANEFTMPLIGTYQLKNATVTLSAAEILMSKGFHLTNETVMKGFMSVRWPSRFEVMHRNPAFIVDGAHNAHGITAVTNSLKDQFPSEKIVFLIGILADKNVDEMIDLLIPVSKAFVTLTPNSVRAMTSDELAEKLKNKGCVAYSCSSVHEGITKAIEIAQSSGIVCSLGSLYLAGEIRDELEKM